MADLEQIMRQAVEAYLSQAIPAKAMEMKQEPPEMLTIDQVCNRAGLSRDCVRYRLIPENKIRYIRAGRRFLINWESVCTYLREGDGKEGGV